MWSVRLSRTVCVGREGYEKEMLWKEMEPAGEVSCLSPSLSCVLRERLERRRMRRAESLELLSCGTEGVS